MPLNLRLVENGIEKSQKVGFDPTSRFLPRVSGEKRCSLLRVTIFGFYFVSYELARPIIFMTLSTLNEFSFNQFCKFYFTFHVSLDKYRR